MEQEEEEENICDVIYADPGRRALSVSTQGRGVIYGIPALAMRIDVRRMDRGQGVYNHRYSTKPRNVTGHSPCQR